MRPKGFDQPKTEKKSSKDNSWPNDIRFPESSGETYGLKVYIEKHKFKSKIEESNDDDMDNVVRVSVHNPLSLADIRTSGAEIELGFTTTITITPSVFETLESGRSLTMKQRKCKYADEIDQANSSFVQYNQINCLYECHIKRSFAKCGCTPWDYFGPSPICDKFGRRCFINTMKNTEGVKNCNCPNDCTVTRYAISVTSTPIEPKTFCKNAKVREYFGQSGKSVLVQRYEELVYGKEANMTAMEICKQRVSDVAVVKFYLASQTVTKTTRGQRVSFAAMLSQIGTVMLKSISDN